MARPGQPGAMVTVCGNAATASAFGGGSIGATALRRANGFTCYQPIWWPPLMSRLEPVIQAASSDTRNATA